MIPAAGLVIIVVVFHEERRVIRQGIDHAASEFVFAGLKVCEPLCAHGFLRLVAGFLAVGGVEVSLRVHAGHVVHRGSDRGFDAGIEGCSIDRHAAPAADADDTDAVRIGLLMQGKKIHRGHEVFGIDVGRSHVPDVPAALAGKGRVEGKGEEAALRHGLRVQAGALFLHGPEGTGNGDRGKLSFRILRYVQVCRERDAVAVHEGRFFVINLIALRKRLIPLGHEFKFFFSDHRLISFVPA